MQQASYYKNLYNLQDKVLEIVAVSGEGLYLTGGTALGRVYLKHRYSDDLDLFMNNSPEFNEKVKAVMNQFKNIFKDDLTIVTTDKTFVRCSVNSREVMLKIDFVNDLDYRYGELQRWDKFPLIDHPLNILSNKTAALSRFAEKDMADILFLSYHYSFNWEFIIREGQKKDLWVNPMDISNIINTFPVEEFNKIRWIDKPDSRKTTNDLKIIAKEILNGAENSLFKSSI